MALDSIYGHFGGFLGDFVKGQAVSFLKLVTMASRYGVVPRGLTRRLLAQTVQSHSYVVYRGISFTNLDDETRAALEALQVGSPVPDCFFRPNGSQVVIHATTDLSVAQGYASHGVAGMVMSFGVHAAYVIADTTKLDTILKPEDLSEENWEYFRKSSELLVVRDAAIDLREDSQVVELRIPDGSVTPLSQG